MLILVRHGESAWNAVDRFAGRTDVALTPLGRLEAAAAGRWLAEEDALPDVVHTSLLRRAINSAHLMLDACGRSDVPVLHSRRLNERHYGALQGMLHHEAVERYGAEQVARWRNGIEESPPVDARGRGESLAHVRLRLKPYVERRLRPELEAGKTVLVVSHDDVLRMLSQLVCGLSDASAVALAVPTGIPRLVADPFARGERVSSEVDDSVGRNE